MTEENTADVVVEEVTQAATEAAVSSQEQDTARDFEKEARASGWVPETEWKGERRPSKFLDAKTFVERGEELTPFIRAENKRLQERLDRQEKDFSKRLERLDKANEATRKTAQENYEREIARIGREQRAAVAEGDVEKFDALTAERGKIKAPEPIEAPEQADPESVFKEKNTWYGEDEDLTAYADGISQAYLKKHPNSTLEENLTHTAERVRAAFPSKFTKKPAANGHAAVDGGGDFPLPSGKSSLESKLPAEALSQAKKDVADRLYKSVDDWAKIYFGR